jgi:predicted NodU family carbamoyl transferase
LFKNYTGDDSFIFNIQKNPFDLKDWHCEFNKIKNVPILFNTSFNLAGDPLVETVTEALDTLKKSDLKYLWLPEIGKLLTKQL